MNSLHWIFEPCALALAHSLWQAALIALFTWALLKSLPGRLASARYWAAILALTAIVISFGLTFAYFSPKQAVFPGSAFAPIAAEPASVPLQSSVPTTPPSAHQPATLAPPPAPIATTPIPLPAQPILIPENPAPTSPWKTFLGLRIPQPILPYILGFWLIGAFIMLLRASHAVWLGTRIKHLASPMNFGGEYDLFLHLARQLRVTPRTRMATSHAVTVPGVVGWFWPLVLLPARGLSQLPPEDLKFILAHELAHIKRHDALIDFLQSIIESAFFFNPGVWWLSNTIRLEREAACDLIAIHATSAQPDQYATALANWARLISTSQPGLAATGSHPSGLRIRIQRIFTPNARPQLPGPWIALACLLAAASLFYISLPKPVIAQTSTDATQPFSSTDQFQDRLKRVVHQFPQDKTLQASLDTFSRQAQIPIQVDWEGLKLLGPTPPSPLKDLINSSPMPLQAAIHETFIRCDWSGLPNNIFPTREIRIVPLNDRIFVGPRVSALKRSIQSRNFNVAHLLSPADAKPIPAADLITLLSQSIGQPSDWSPLAAPSTTAIAHAAITGDTLAATAPTAYLDQIQPLLKQLAITHQNSLIQTRTFDVSDINTTLFGHTTSLESIRSNLLNSHSSLVNTHSNFDELALLSKTPLDIQLTNDPITQQPNKTIIVTARLPDLLWIDDQLHKRRTDSVRYAGFTNHNVQPVNNSFNQIWYDKGTFNLPGKAPRPLHEALAQVFEPHSVVMYIDWNALTAIGVTPQTPVAPPGPHPDRPSLLNAVLEQATPKAYKANHAYAENGGYGVRISTRLNLARDVYCHALPVDGLTQPTPDGKFPALSQDEILRKIQAVGSPSDWLPGGVCQASFITPGLLTFTGTRKDSDQVRLILDLLSESRGQPGQLEAIQWRRMRLAAAPADNYTFTAAPFADVLQQITRRSLLETYVNWAQVEKLGLTQNTPITLGPDDFPGKRPNWYDVLDMAITKTGFRPQLEVLNREYGTSIYADNTSRRIIYNIADLTRINSPAYVSQDQIITHIKAIKTPVTWNTSLSYKAEIDANDDLYVTATPDIQFQVKAVLDALRKKAIAATPAQTQSASPAYTPRSNFDQQRRFYEIYNGQNQAWNNNPGRIRVVSLKEAIAIFQEQSRLQITVDWPALATLGLKPESTANILETAVAAPDDLMPLQMSVYHHLATNGRNQWLGIARIGSGALVSTRTIALRASSRDHELDLQALEAITPDQLITLIKQNLGQPSDWGTGPDGFASLEIKNNKLIAHVPDAFLPDLNALLAQLRITRQATLVQSHFFDTQDLAAPALGLTEPYLPPVGVRSRLAVWFQTQFPQKPTSNLPLPWPGTLLAPDLTSTPTITASATGVTITGSLADLIFVQNCLDQIRASRTSGTQSGVTTQSTAQYKQQQHLKFWALTPVDLPGPITPRPLQQALDQLLASRGLAYEVDWAALKSIGIDPATPVTPPGSQPNLITLIRVILKQATPSQHLANRAYADNHFAGIKITTRKALTRTFSFSPDINDLLTPPAPDSPPPFTRQQVLAQVMKAGDPADWLPQGVFSASFNSENNLQLLIANPENLTVVDYLNDLRVQKNLPLASNDQGSISLTQRKLQQPAGGYQISNLPLNEALELTSKKISVKFTANWPALQSANILPTQKVSVSPADFPGQTPTWENVFLHLCNQAGNPNAYYLGKSSFGLYLNATIQSWADHSLYDLVWPLNDPFISYIDILSRIRSLPGAGPWNRDPLWKLTSSDQTVHLEAPADYLAKVDSLMATLRAQAASGVKHATLEKPKNGRVAIRIKVGASGSISAFQATVVPVRLPPGMVQPPKNLSDNWQLEPHGTLVLENLPLGGEYTIQLRHSNPTITEPFATLTPIAITEADPTQEYLITFNKTGIDPESLKRADKPNHPSKLF